MKRRSILAAGLKLGATLPVMGLATPALAQAGFPNRTVRVVIPAGPGGGTDILARLLAPKAASVLGAAIVIENRGGGESLIGTEYVVRAAADGHIVLFSDTSPYIAKILRSRMPFDPLVDLVPVMRAAVGSIMLYGNPTFGARTLPELVARAKADPAGVSFGTSSTGSRLLGEMLKMRAGINLLHVPYRSGGLALTDTLNGTVQLTFNGASNGKPYVLGGELLAIGAAGPRRNPALPDVPSFTEQGFADFPAGSEWGLFAPSGTPPEALAKLNAAFREAAFDPAIADRMSELGFRPDGTAGATYQEEMVQVLRLWAEVVAAAGIQPS
ncbi:Bug family tripartite tricarboxylate transporter substrate binding protein [Roseomonas sp. F4]